MKTIRTVAELRETLAPARREGRSIGLVPTMGAFHDGHLSLMQSARADCEVVVVSLFVNPAQFGPGEDFASYPRDAERDRAIAFEEGVDEIYEPTVEEMYPPGFDTTVSVGDLSSRYEGASRPGHFAAVATVVLKLFHQVRPDIAYFGQKDAQQLAVVRRMTRDLDDFESVAVASSDRLEDERRRERHAHDYVDNVLR